MCLGKGRPAKLIDDPAERIEYKHRRHARRVERWSGLAVVIRHEWDNAHQRHPYWIIYGGRCFFGDRMACSAGRYRSMSRPIGRLEINNTLNEISLTQRVCSCRIERTQRIWRVKHTRTSVYRLSQYVSSGGRLIFERVSSPQPRRVHNPPAHTYSYLIEGRLTE